MIFFDLCFNFIFYIKLLKIQNNFIQTFNKLNSQFPTVYNSIGKPLPEPNGRAKIIVTIPAMNEENYIWKTLSALEKQTNGITSISPKLYEVLVLCNHCSDTTEELCILFQQLHPDFPLYIFKTNDSKINNVGAARKILMDTASQRISADGLIITTDADTKADINWLNAFLSLQAEPFDLMCGVINPDLKGLSAEGRRNLHQKRAYLDLVSRLESQLYHQEYDPWPRHSHNSGPNMAIRNSVYRQIGGIPPLSCLEDIALYQKVIGEGFKVHHSFKPKVTTSCRSMSRVPGGFGTQIKNWNTSITEEVEGLEKLCDKFKAFSEIREYYREPKDELFTSISKRLKLNNCHLNFLFQTHPQSSSLIVSLENELKFHLPWNLAYPNKLINIAIIELEGYFANFFQTTNSYRSSSTSVTNSKELE